MAPTLRHGTFSMQGKRKTMEDKHVALGPSDLPSGVRDDLRGLFCVFDGHGGHRAAEYAHECLPGLVLESPLDPQAAIDSAVRRVDTDFLALAAESELADGTTATVVAVTKDGQVIVGNVGDSEAVLARTVCSGAPEPSAGVERAEAQESGLEVLPLSAIHNVAQNEGEGKRVVEAGGNIFHNRLGHPCLNPAYFSIAVSRAIGDLMFKADSYTDGKPSGLTADPEFRSVAVSEGDKFLIIACDGLWSVIPHARVVDIAAKALKDLGSKDLDAVCKTVADAAFDEGSTDNITVMIVMMNE